MGNDIFASVGDPLVAVDDGEVRFGSDPLGGNIAVLKTPDRTQYYYAHLQGFEGANRRVQVGERIGYVGRTGNVPGTAQSHLHFEVHPGGGAAINPFPLLSAAPRVARETRGAGRAILVAGLSGVLVWALLNPVQARRLLPV